MRVGVVDKNGTPLMPCHPARARKLLDTGKADVVSKNPFSIRLLDREGGETEEMEIKIDPGSKTTGMVLVVKGAKRGWFVVAAFEIHHRGQQIVNALLSRRSLRSGRRSRKTRYRKPRFLNRTREPGWLPPSLRSRVDNTLSRIRKLLPFFTISGIACEDVKFDMQLLRNPEIDGVQYQQGTLLGYTVREYLLEKWGRKCTYCQASGVPLQIEHIVARSKGGSNAASNLCLACEPCNRKKGNRDIQEYLQGKKELLRKILAQAKAPLKDAAAVNTTRKFIIGELLALGLPLCLGSGGETKFNRCNQKHSKAHWIDAACVGESGSRVDSKSVDFVTVIHAKGRGSRQMCKPDRFGFPRTAAKTVKRIRGFQTGDQVKLVQTSGKYQGVYMGEVGIRATGQFDIKAGKNKITAPYTRFTLVSRFDGYRYEKVALENVA